MPRQNSINKREKYRIKKSSDLRPSANKMPNGNAKIIPKKVSIKVNYKPPHSLVSIYSKPNPPFIKTKAIIGKIKIKKNKI